jgi:hypothetical protein
MAKLVKEYLIKQEAADGEYWPFVAAQRAELLRSLAHAQVLGQSHARRQSTEGNFSPAAIDIAKKPFARTSVIEMDATKAMPDFNWQTAEDNAHVLLVHMVDAVTTRRRHRES